ncbi:hypothetical protein [Streptomyces sp. NPDC005408]|uniref:hypothetical protein n=1 Tax=Streptomyces sp. NPDC005408 TaxID=3155341 RepID=UPI0033B56F3E
MNRIRRSTAAAALALAVTTGGFATSCGGGGEGASKPPAQTETELPPAEETAPTTPEEGPSPQGGIEEEVGPGTHQVGKDMPPGTYRTQGPSDSDLPNCYWARLKDASGEFDAIIANGNAQGPTTVTVNTGEYFETSGCRNWIKEEGPPPQEKAPQPESPAGVGPGTHQVGKDMPPGTYRTQGPSDSDLPNCYWARLKDASGEFDAIIANGNPQGPTTVTVNTGEYFQTSGCHNWIKIG